MQRLAFLLILVTILALLFAPAVAGAEGESVLARVYYQSEADLGWLAARLDVWEVQRSAGYLLVYLPATQAAALQAGGWQVEVDAGLTRSLLAPVPRDPLQVSGIPGYPCYRSVEELQGSFDQLVTLYPDLAARIDIGDSWDKATPGGPAGYDLSVLRLTNSQVPGPKPRFFLMAEAHAREYVTAETAALFAEYLLENYGQNAELTWLLDETEIHILALANPDGRKKAEAGVLWRKNTNTSACSESSYGVDLNRNNGYKWGGAGASTNPCDETYRGAAANSEPETQAIQAYVQGLFPDRRGPGDSDPAPADYAGLFISLHSYGNLVLYPFGWTDTPAPNHTQLQTLGRKLAYFNGYIPQRAYQLYPTSGSNDEWAYGELGLPGFTFEMGSTFFEQCSSFTSTIWPANRASLLYSLKAARLPYRLPAGPDVENVQLSAAPVTTCDSVTLTASANDTRYSILSGFEPAQAIQAARYTLDLPSWEEGAQAVALQAQDGAFNNPVEALTGELSTAGLSLGRHILYLEAQDVAGNWGVPTAIFLDVASPDALFKVSPAAERLHGKAGDTVNHTLVIANLGGEIDTYAISAVTTPGWATTITPPVTVPVSPCGSVVVTVAVQIPAGAVAPASATTQVTVTSQANPAAHGYSTLETAPWWRSIFAVIRK